MNKITKGWQNLETKIKSRPRLGKITPVLMFFIVLNTVAMLISNIVTVKQFDLGIMVMAGGGIIFPITYICSDIFSEVYGYKWTRMSAWIAFAMNLLMVAMFETVIAIPGVDPNINEAMKTTLQNAPWSLAAGMTAFMIGDLMNDLVFKWLKGKQGDKGFWFRALLSSLIGELVDSCIFFPLGLNILPKLFLGFEFVTWEQLAISIPLQALIKTGIEVVLLPITIFLVKKVKKYESNYEVTK